MHATPPRRPEPGHRLSPAGAAGLLGIACLAVVLGACASGPAQPSEAELRERARGQARAALELYESEEFVLAARRFARAAELSALARDPSFERRSLAGECASWLRARKLPELGECSTRLERLQKRARRPEPGVNTVIALGAVAGDRPLPELKLPNDVARLIRATEEAP